jgi:hypothetical protein
LPLIRTIEDGFHLLRSFKMAALNVKHIVESINSREWQELAFEGCTYHIYLFICKCLPHKQNIIDICMNCIRPKLRYTHISNYF